MPLYNTMNPIGPYGSVDPRDLNDNSANLDVRVNSLTEEQWDDRLGVSRWTWYGFEQRMARFLASTGYVVVGDYEPTAGIVLDEYNQVVRDVSGTSPTYWRLNPNTPVPYTTDGSGMDEGGAFVLAGDDVMLRQELANPATGGETVYVTTPSGEQSLTDALTAREFRIVTPEMFGAVGDGVADDSQAWLDALATGYIIDAMPGAVYNVGAGFPIDNAKVRMSGAKFLLTAQVAGSGTVAFMITGETFFDNFTVQCQAGIRVDQVLEVAGTRANLQNISIISEDQQANTTAAAVACMRVSGAFVKIGTISIENFDNVMEWSGSDGQFDTFVCLSYSRGFWFNQNERIVFNSICCRGRSANSDYSPGNNGVLMQSPRFVNGNGIFVFDAGEHGVRMAGPTGTKDIKIGQIASVNSRGAGVKWRCATGQYNERINIGSIHCEDCGDPTSPLEGESGLRMDRCRRVQIGSYQVNRRANTYSCGLGVSWFDCFDVQIGTAMINDCAIDAVQARMLSTDDDGVNITRNSWDLTIGSGVVNACGGHMVFLEARTAQFRRININLKGFLIGGGVLRAESYSGGSIADDCMLELQGRQAAGATMDPISGNALNSACLLDVKVYQGPGTIAVKNGSFWWNLDSGVRSIKASTGWVALA